MSTRLTHQILIRRPPLAVFAYVTQPWRWCEWHPSSLGATRESARAEEEPLAIGERFVERIVLKPLAPLPPTLHRLTRYTVEQSTAPSLWQVHGEMRDGWLRIRYELTMVDAATTRFQRTLDYAARGLSRCWVPLLSHRTEALSRRALAQLKARLERDL